MPAPGRPTSPDEPTHPSLGARVLVLGAALVLAAVVSVWAIGQAQRANVPYMGLPPAPAYNPAGAVWFVIAYLPWLAPAILAVRSWRGWTGWGLALLVGGLATWFVPWVTHATRLIA
ncbi:hypothetical protein [Cellulomonas sp. P5_C6]